MPGYWTPKHILQVIRQGDFGGGESYLLQLVNSLPTSLFRSTILSYQEGKLLDVFRERGIPVYVIQSPSRRDLSSFWHTYRLMRKLRPDLVHFHGTRGAFKGIWAAKYLGIPAIYHAHGWTFHPGLSLFNYWLRVQMERVLCRIATKAIAVSVANKHEGEMVLGANNLTVIRNGIELQRFDPVTTTKLNRADFGIPDDAFVVGFISRITGQKDPITAIKAFALAYQQNPKLHLLLTGNGDLDSTCQELIIQLGIGQAISRTPSTSMVASWLTLIDAFLLPSLWEGYSLSLMEAMALGKPCIATNIDANIEVLGPDLGQYIFPIGNEAACAELILKLAQQPTENFKLGQIAIRRAQDLFSFNRVVRENMENYSAILHAQMPNQAVKSHEAER